ncbi:ligninase lg6 precursor [Alternaria burnsii]|uniref:Peroxidase n=1 Tax=Alternaria burnsii TaxID=1187904 RepID=A0A8H7B8G1_9PLEO|nr:ligninase lg6 precursor [Alternaria burnsii]KAF7678340.1 ligninase lg6 precursor [Alternaria burnsii]
MRSFALILIALAASSTSAFDIWPRSASKCPSVWSDVASELQSDFAGCGADAHGAIRAPFHDCINNGCDGSLILTDECSRSENAGLSAICKKLKGWSDKYNVTAADMIQFAAATAISACPLGPRVQALVGRKDSSKAAPVGSVPSSRGTLISILGAFGAKGFSADDVVALMGTHSVALQFNDDPSQAGKSLDSTPSTYDNTFYKETKDGTAPYSLQSDVLLSNSSQTAKTWSSFADDADAWSSAFTGAWNRFAVIGSDASKLQDCSSLIPSSSASKKRQAFNARFTKMMSAKFRV